MGGVKWPIVLALCLFPSNTHCTHSFCRRPSVALPGTPLVVSFAVVVDASGHKPLGPIYILCGRRGRERARDQPAIFPESDLCGQAANERQVSKGKSP